MPTDTEYLQKLWNQTVERINRMVIDGADFDEAKAILAAERRLIDDVSKRAFVKQIQGFKERDLWFYTRRVLSRNRGNAALAKMGKRQNAWNGFFYGDVMPRPD